MKYYGKILDAKDLITKEYADGTTFYDLPAGIDFEDITSPEETKYYRKTSTPVLINKYALDTTTYTTYTLDADGLKNNGVLVATYTQIENDWSLTYSSFFIIDSAGSLVRYTLDGNNYACYQNLPNATVIVKFYKNGAWYMASSSSGGNDYSPLLNKPKINGNVLSGDKTSAQLNLLGINDIQSMTNKTFDASLNTLRNILVSMFSSTAISTTIPTSSATASDLKFATEKAVIDAILRQMSSIFQIQGGKDTEAEILALTGSADMEAWICKENSRIYYWKNNTWNWVALTDLTPYQKKDDTGLTTQAKTIVGAINEIAEKSSTINDKSEEFRTGNQEYYNVSKAKLFDFNSISNLFFDGTRKTAITDLQTARRNILQLPLAVNYPASVSMNITIPSGTRTSMEEKNKYYVSGGSGYINKEAIKNKTFRIKAWIPVNKLKTETECTFTTGLDASKPATGYYYATDTLKWYKDKVVINVNEYSQDISIYDAGKYYVKFNGTVPSNLYLLSVTEGSTTYDSNANVVTAGYYGVWITLAYGETKNIYMIDYSNTTQKGIVDGDKIGPENEYGHEVYNVSGEVLYKTDNGYQYMHHLKSVSISINIDFIYYCLLYKNGCEVDSNGIYSNFGLATDSNFTADYGAVTKWGTGQVATNVVELTYGGLEKAPWGFMGTYNIQNINYESSNTQLIGEIDNATKKLSINGNVAIERVVISTTF